MASDEERLGRIRAEVREQWAETLMNQIQTAIPIADRIGPRRFRIPTFDDEWFIELYTAAERIEGGES